jgi:hypothetical protein
MSKQAARIKRLAGSLPSIEAYRALQAAALIKARNSGASVGRDGPVDPLAILTDAEIKSVLMQYHQKARA